MAILGISTNTRLVGLAIINQGKLVDYSIHLHKASWSASKANEIIASIEPCVRQYSIKRIVLSIPHEYHQTNEIKSLLSKIQTYVETNHVPLEQKTWKEIHSVCPPDKKKTQKVLMEHLTTLYPQLTYCHIRERRNKKRYYIKVFEAVAAAMLG